MAYEGAERRRRWARLERWWRNLVPFLAVCLAAWAVYGVMGQADKQAGEQAERRDQMCRLFEGDHAADVERLARTYRYLDTLPRSEWGKPLTAAIVRQLSELEQEARVDSAPPFCDEPNTGLPEPDPDLPEPQNFDRLLERP